MDLRGFPVLLLILLGAVAVLAGLSIPVYFAARRPRRGTTEWMRCIETPHFSPLRLQRLYPADLGWLPLAGVLPCGDAHCLDQLIALFEAQLRQLLLRADGGVDGVVHIVKNALRRTGRRGSAAAAAGEAAFGRAVSHVGDHDNALALQGDAGGYRRCLAELERKN